MHPFRRAQSKSCMSQPRDEGQNNRTLLVVQVRSTLCVSGDIHPTIPATGTTCKYQISKHKTATLVRLTCIVCPTHIIQNRPYECEWYGDIAPREDTLDSGKKEFFVDLFVEEVTKWQRVGTLLLIAAQNDMRPSEQIQSLEIVCKWISNSSQRNGNYRCQNSFRRLTNF